MNATAALAYFTLEVGRAAAAYGIPVPAVSAVMVDERHPAAPSTVVAYVPPVPRGFEPEVHVLWHWLWDTPKGALRCVARHEVAHIALGHARGARSVEELRFFEDVVNAELRRRWKEPSNCGVR